MKVWTAKPFGPSLHARCTRQAPQYRRITLRIRCNAERPKGVDRWLRPVLLGGTALLAACMTQAQQPACAELETVAPASVTSLAKPLTQQRVEKGKVWLVIVAGAAGLFGATVLLENNEALFPAIARANKAMAAAQKARKAKAKVEEAIELGGNPDERLQSAVEAGLSDARQRVLQEPASTAKAPGAKAPNSDSESAAASWPEHIRELEEQDRDGQQNGESEWREGLESASNLEQKQSLVPSSSKDR